MVDSGLVGRNPLNIEHGDNRGPVQDDVVELGVDDDQVELLGSTSIKARLTNYLETVGFC